MTRKADFQKLIDQIFAGETQLRQRDAVAKLLHVSPNTVKAWIQPQRTQEPPEWAFELFALKTGLPYAAAEAAESEQAA